jgi:anti-anti-sigma regulatory factor
MSEEGLQIQHSYPRPAVALVHVTGPLNEATAEQLRRHLDEHLEERRWAIVLDLTAVSSIERGAVPSLADVAGRAGLTDVGFYLVADHLLEQALARDDGLVGLFDVHASVDSALCTLGGRP